MRQPPVTGGNSATSSPSRSGVESAATAWLTAMRTGRPDASSLAKAPPRERGFARERYAFAGRAQRFAKPGEIDEANGDGSVVAHDRRRVAPRRRTMD
jgi:hypothetical protein